MWIRTRAPSAQLAVGWQVKKRYIHVLQPQPLRSARAASATTSGLPLPRPAPASRSVRPACSRRLPYSVVRSAQPPQRGRRSAASRRSPSVHVHVQRAGGRRVQAAARPAGPRRRSARGLGISPSTPRALARGVKLRVLSIVSSLGTRPGRRAARPRARGLDRCGACSRSRVGCSSRGTPPASHARCGSGVPVRPRHAHPARDTGARSGGTPGRRPPSASAPAPCRRLSATTSERSWDPESCELSHFAPLPPRPWRAAPGGGEIIIMPAPPCIIGVFFWGHRVNTG